MNKAAFGGTIWGCQAKNPNFPSNTKRVCARRFPKGPEPAAASGTGACRPLCGKKAGGTSGTTRSGESRDYVGSPEDEDRRSVGIAKEQLVATIAIPGPIGKPFGGAEVAEPQAQKSQLFLVKLLYGMFGISLTAPLCALESIFHGRQTETARSSAPSGNASLPDGFFFDRFAIGNDGGLTPIPLPEGHCPSDSLPRFALMARYSERISASGNRGASAASDSRAPR